MVTGGYAHLGEKSFPGAPAVGLHGSVDIGRHVALGLTATAARARHPHELTIGSTWRPSRTVSELHNYLYSAHAVLAYRTNNASRWALTVGPTFGVDAVGRKEQHGAANKIGLGVWNNLTYRHLWGSRFNLEAVFHPRILSRGPTLQDADVPFSDVNLLVLDIQLGLSFDLKKPTSIL
ncbi:hypothetical protein GCM10023186_28640 [Hymenobacter koreensis]|uniref:Porin n=2 Tax=Hymenobacter koreensis TaxID=1084523 RepID=A0ABP8J5D0_9BACT